MLEIISICMTLIGFGERILKLLRESMRIFRISVFKLSLSVSIIVGCTISLTNNLGYAIFLKIQTKYTQFKLKREIKKLTCQLDEVYIKIGQGVYDKEQSEYLSRLAQQYNHKLGDMKNEIALSEENAKKKIQMEQILMDLTAKESEVRLSAMEKLGEIADKQYLPYIKMALLDSNEQVRRKAMTVIENLDTADDMPAENVSDEDNE